MQCHRLVAPAGAERPATLKARAAQAPETGTVGYSVTRAERRTRTRRALARCCSQQPERKRALPSKKNVVCRSAKPGLSGRLAGKTLTVQLRSMPRRGDEHGSPAACAGGVVSGAVTHVDCEPFGGSQDSRRGVTQLDRACQLLPSSGFPGSVSQCHFRSKLLPLEAVCSMLDLIDKSVV